MDEGRSAARKIIIASGEGERGSGDLPPGTLPRHANALARAEEEHSRASLREDLPAHSRFTRSASRPSTRPGNNPARLLEAPGVDVCSSSWAAPPSPRRRRRRRFLRSRARVDPRRARADEAVRGRASRDRRALARNRASPRAPARPSSRAAPRSRRGPRAPRPARLQCMPPRTPERAACVASRRRRSAAARSRSRAPRLRLAASRPRPRMTNGIPPRDLVRLGARRVGPRLFPYARRRTPTCPPPPAARRPAPSPWSRGGAASRAPSRT